LAIVERVKYWGPMLPCTSTVFVDKSVLHNVSKSRQNVGPTERAVSVCATHCTHTLRKSSRSELRGAIIIIRCLFLRHPTNFCIRETLPFSAIHPSVWTSHNSRKSAAPCDIRRARQLSAFEMLPCSARDFNLRCELLSSRGKMGGFDGGEY
jgi:hypothetical protein